MALRLQQINPSASAVSTSSSVTDHHLRKNFPAKIVRQVVPWKVAEEIIGVSVPRKARSASAKRSQECWISGGSNGGEPVPRQASTSPARAATTVAAPPAAPISPSSSNVSVRKKMKPIGSKHRPPKVSKTSSIQEAEIEFEIAEVLYGMTRGPTKQETASVPQKPNSRDANGSSNDAKSRGSSPISILPPTELPQSSVLQQNSNSMAVAPKRKRPRPPKLEEDRPANLAVPAASASSATKTEAQEQEKVENSLPKSEKKMPSAVENGCGSEELGNSQIPSVSAELLPQDSLTKCDSVLPDSEPPKAEPDGLDATEAKEEIPSPVQGSPCSKIDADQEDAITTKPESAVSTEDRPREEKFEIDLMAPPSGKSSPERDESMADLVRSQKPVASETETIPKKETVKAEEDKGVGHVEEAGEVGLTVKKTETMEEQDLQKQMVKERVFDLQVDAEKLDKDGDKLQVPKQATKAIKNESKAEKAVQSAALPLPMTIAGWPRGLHSMGYMGQIPPPLQAVSMDGGAGSATAMQPPNFLLPPHRPKRCATHYYIAQKINYLRQAARMNHFWTGPAGFAAPQCGAKPCNLNVLPTTESAILGNPLQGSFSGRNLSSQDKASGDHAFNDKNAAVMFMDSSQRKQLMLQQAPQPPSANNMLQAPTLIFPLNQQQPTPVPPSGAVKSATTVSNAASSSSATNSVLGSAGSSGSVPGTATTVTFNYANLPANEAQYLAMLNNGYQFPIPPHVGGPQLYRGSHHPAMPVPFFNGPFYSPPMLHHSQLQQQHLQSQPPAVQLGNQNSGTASGSSSSQKHQQQQQPQACVSNGGLGISTGFPTLKQCQQPQQNYLQSHHSRQPESEMGNGDSRCSTDGRVSHPQKSVYNHSFSMPVHPQNFTIMSPSALGGGNQGEKQQQQGLKGGMELNQSQAFAMSFAPFGSAAASSGLDLSSMAHNPALFQSHPEAARHGYQMAAPAASSRTAQQKNHQNIEERKVVNDSISSNASGEEERKMKMAGKAPTSMPHTLTFSRPDNDHSISSVMCNSVVDSSSKNLNAISASGNGSRASSRSGVMPSTTTPLSNPPNSHYSQQQLIQLQKQQQMHQQHLQQQLAVQAKTASNNANANLYSERLSSSVGKFPNVVSVFPQPLSQGSSTQVSQWKTSTKAGTAPVPSSEASTPSGKSLPLQQGRTQLSVPNSSHTQISFGVNAKSSCMQQFTSNNPSPSSAGGVAGSPPTSISKSAGGSPRTADSKACPVTMPSASQPAKNAPSSSSRKSSPVSGRHVPSILGNSNVSSAQSSVIKSQQPQPQQPLPKQPFQQAAQSTVQQPFLSNFYMAQSPQSTSNSTNSGSYQKRQPEQQQHQQQHNSMAVSSTGMMSLCSPSHGFLHPAQYVAQSAASPHLLMPTAIPYIHSVPAVPVKSAEQKPAAGNDILHQSWQPEKR